MGERIDPKMNVRVRRVLGAALVWMALVVYPACATEQPNLTALNALWHDASPQAAAEQPLPPKKAWVIREREVSFDPQLLAILKNAAARPHPPIAVELFDGRIYELDVMSTVSRLSDLSTVRGRMKDQARASWSLVISGNLVNGTIQMGDRLYKVEHVLNGRHRLLEVDPATVPPE